MNRKLIFPSFIHSFALSEILVSQKIEFVAIGLLRATMFFHENSSH